MPEKIEIPTREQVERFLPGAMKKALCSYHDLGKLKAKGAQTIEASKDYHVACKPVIAHIELLVKLDLRIENYATQSGIPESDLSQIMAVATEELRRYKAENSDEEAEDLA